MMRDSVPWRRVPDRVVPGRDLASMRRVADELDFLLRDGSPAGGAPGFASPDHGAMTVSSHSHEHDAHGFTSPNPAENAPHSHPHPHYADHDHDHHVAVAGPDDSFGARLESALAEARAERIAADDAEAAAARAAAREALIGPPGGGVATARELLEWGVSADRSVWDGAAVLAAAESSDYPDEFCSGICALLDASQPPGTGRWGLPHHQSPVHDPNAGAVLDALEVLDAGVPGLDEAARSRAIGHLEGHLADFAPGLHLQRIAARCRI